MDRRKRIDLLLMIVVVSGSVIMIGIRIHIRSHKQYLERQLSAAVSRDDAATVIALLDRGVTPRKSARRPSTLITMACTAGAKHTLLALLRRGEHPGANDVAIPALRGDPEMVDVLMKAGASPNAMAYGPYPLMICLAENRKTQMIKRLISYGADPNAASLVTGYRPCGFTTLMTSIAVNDVNSVRVLLDAGAKVDVRVRDQTSELDGYTALMIAEKRKSVDEAELLLKHGARTDTIASDGMTPIALAKKNGGMLKVLAERLQVE